MTRQFMIDPVTGARVIAEKAEQVAHEVHRTVAAVEAIVDGVKDVTRPSYFHSSSGSKSRQASPPAEVPVLVSTEGVRYKIHRVADSNAGSQRRTGPVGGGA